MNEKRKKSAFGKILLTALGAFALSWGLLALAGCDRAGSSGSSGSGSESEPGVVTEDTTITVAASPVPHADILNNAVAPLLEEQGYTLVVEEYSDYALPNSDTDSGEVDANFYQHVPFLERFNSDEGTDLVDVASVHIEPMSLYGETGITLEELPDDATVVIPNDASNAARALQLLDAGGLIELTAGAGEDATLDDIEDNPHNLDIIEAEASTLPVLLGSVDMAVINGNYALEAGLSDKLILLTEDPDPTYANVLVVKNGNEDLPKIQALAEALTSQEVTEYIEDEYAGEVVVLN